MSRWKSEPGNCSGDQYQDMLQREEHFGSQSRMWLKEWNLTPMKRDPKPKECLAQANLTIVRGFHQSLGYKNTILRESGDVLVKGRARILLWWLKLGKVATRRTFRISIQQAIEGMEPHSNEARLQTRGVPWSGKLWQKSGVLINPWDLRIPY